MAAAPGTATPKLGLTSEEAQRRLRRYGKNVLAEPRRPHPLARFCAQLLHLLALLLWAGAALAWAGGMPQLSLAIVVVIVVNAVFAYVQERKAERAIEALRRMLPQAARVVRDGVQVEISAEELVPGDLLVLAAGDRVSADARLVERVRLRVDQSALTGESWPVEPEDEVYAGTYVTAGSALAVVTATGMATRFGRVAELAQRVRSDPSPLERELRHLTRFVALLSLAVGSLFFLVAGFLGMGWQERFLFAVGVTVANVPEGLLPTVTLSLALATQRMARRQALVRRLSSVETLGETTVICTDKTGTLTENEMTVVRVWTPEVELEVEGAGYEPYGRFLRDGRPVDPRPYAELLRCGLLCNDSRVQRVGERRRVVGDPTEAALVVLAEKGGLRPTQEVAHYPRVGEIPFDSRRKRMTTVHLDGEGHVAYVKGAPEEVVPRAALPPDERERALRAAEEMERQGLRVLALARRWDPPLDLRPETVERALELLGLVGLLDPPRPEVPEAIARCRQAGIRVIMVTGDSGWTAEAVARRIGLVGETTPVVGPQGEVHGGREVQVLGPRTVDGMDDETLARTLADHDVIFARITPEQKLRLARVLRAAGEVVAMTGDGVNDAPALKEADIGVAMGSGTDVAKETADMILLDDNFASIVAAVEEGRAVFDNIRRFASYHFCSNVGELIPFLAWGLSLGAIPLPLVVMQILAIDLGTDMLPAIALGTERPEPGTMARPPRPRGERLLDRRVLARVYGFVGPLEGLAAMASFLAGYLLGGWRPPAPLPDSGRIYVQATTMTQTGIVMAQVGAGFAMRTGRRSVFEIGLLSNRLLLVGVAFELALAAALVYAPGLNAAFHQAPIGPVHWLVLLSWPFLVVLAEEGRKALLRRLAARGRPS